MAGIKDKNTNINFEVSVGISDKTIKTTSDKFEKLFDNLFDSNAMKKLRKLFSPDDLNKLEQTINAIGVKNDSLKQHIVENTRTLAKEVDKINKRATTRLFQQKELTEYTKKLGEIVRLEKTIVDLEAQKSGKLPSKRARIDESVTDLKDEIERLKLELSNTQTKSAYLSRIAKKKGIDVLGDSETAYGLALNQKQVNSKYLSNQYNKKIVATNLMGTTISELKEKNALQEKYNSLATIAQIKEASTSEYANARTRDEKTSLREKNMLRQKEIESLTKRNAKEIAGSNNIKRQQSLVKENHLLNNELSVLKLVAKEFNRIDKSVLTTAKATQTWTDKLKNAIANAGTLEKVFNRMAFVMTATASYTIFNAITSSIKDGLTNAIQLESVLARINALSRGENQSYVKAGMSGQVKQGYDTQDVFKASKEAISSQYTPEQTQYLLGVAGKMGIAGDTGLYDSMQAIITTLQSYNMEVERATEVSDWFFKVIDVGNVDIEQLAPNLGKITSTASLLDISLDEVGASIATMTKAGLSTNVAITSLNQLLLNMSAPTEEAKAIYDEYNISMDLSQVKVKGLAGVVKDLNKLTDDEIVKIASSNRGFRALAIALNNNASWRKNLLEISQASGETEQAYNDQMKTTEMQLKVLKGEFVEFGMQLGKVVTAGNWFYGGLTNIIAGLNSTTGKVVMLTLAVAGLVKEVKTLSKALDFLKANWIMVVLSLTVTGAMALFGYFKRENEKVLEAMEQIENKNKEVAYKELKSQNEKAKLLRTYIDLKEGVKKKDFNDMEQKKLLATVTEKLASTYKIASNNISDYRTELEKTEGVQNKLAGGITELNKAKAFREFIDTRKRNSGLIGDQMGGLKGALPTMMLDGTIVNDRAESIGNNNIYSSNNINKLLDNIYTDPQFTLNAHNKKNTLFTLQSTVDSIKKLRNQKLTDSNKAETAQKRLELYEEYRQYIADTNKALETLTSAINYIKSTEVAPIDKSVYEVSTTNNKLTASQIAKRNNDIMQNAINDWKHQINLYRLGGKKLQEMLDERKKFIGIISGHTTTENQNELESSSFNDVVNVLNSLTNKNVSSYKKGMNNATSIEDYNSSYEQLKNELTKKIEDIEKLQKEYTADNQNILLSDSLDQIKNELDIAINNYEKEFLQQLTKAQVAKEQNEKRLDAELKIKRISKETLRGKSIIDLEALKNEYSDSKMILEYIDSELSKRSVLIDKLKQKMDEIDAEEDNLFNTMTKGGDYTKLRDNGKKRDAIKNSGLSEQDQKPFLTDLDKKDEKLKNAVIVDTTQDFVSSLKNVWDGYYSYRMAQIDAEKEKQLSALDERVKSEYRSAFWLEREKTKINKHAENERKKINKAKKASMVAEATATYMLGMLQIASSQLKLGAVFGIPLMLLLQGLLTGTYASSLASISMQKFGEGGKVIGKKHSEGGVPILAEGGEYVVKEKAVRGHEQFFDQIQDHLAKGKSVESFMYANTNNLSGNSSNKSINVSNNNTGLEKKLDDVVESIKGINIEVGMYGEYLSDVKLAKKVASGNKQRRIL